MAALRAGLRLPGGRPRVGLRPGPAGDDRRRLVEPARSPPRRGRSSAGWYDLLTEVATEAAERFGGLGPFSPAEVGDADRQRVPRRPRRCCCSGSTATSCRSGPACAASASSSGPPRSAAAPRDGEPMRARNPTTRGYVERDGVKLHWERSATASRRSCCSRRGRSSRRGTGRRRSPYLARQHRVVTFDGRGCGRSDRPVGAEALHASPSSPPTPSRCSTPRAPSGPCSSACRRGALWAIQVAADHPERVLGARRDRPGGAARASRSRARRRTRSTSRSTTTEGWAKYNRHYWERDYEGFLEFFFGQMFPEPHSTKQIEDCVGWGLETDAATLIDTERGVSRPAPRAFAATCAHGSAAPSS